MGETLGKVDLGPSFRTQTGLDSFLSAEDQRRASTSHAETEPFVRVRRKKQIVDSSEHALKFVGKWHRAFQLKCGLTCRVNA